MDDKKPPTKSVLEADQTVNWEDQPIDEMRKYAEEVLKECEDTEKLVKEVSELQDSVKALNDRKHDLERALYGLLMRSTQPASEAEQQGRLNLVKTDLEELKNARNKKAAKSKPPA